MNSFFLLETRLLKNVNESLVSLYFLNLFCLFFKCKHLIQALELFFFLGDSLHCPPLDRAYKSKPLSHYPEHVSWNPFDAHGICMLSLPQGLRFRTQKHSIEPHFHSFATTREDGKRCHGFSLIFYEEVRNQDICNAMHTLQVREYHNFSYKNCLFYSFSFFLFAYSQCS